MKDMTALVVRCPNISDGARVTLLEMALHQGSGRMPSLNELRRIRQTSRSTVQAHIDELVNIGVLTKTYGGLSKVVITIERDRLLELNGLDNREQIQPWLSDYAAGETSDKETIRTVIKNVSKWNAQDAVNYFNLLGHRKGQKKYAGAEVRGLFNKLLTKYGAKTLKKMMDYFAANFNRMSCAYKPEILLLKQAKFVEAVYQ